MGVALVRKLVEGGGQGSSRATGVHCVRWNSAGTYAMSVGVDGVARLWNPATGALVHAYDRAGHPLRTVAVAPDSSAYLAGGGGDKAAMLVDVATGTVVRRLRGHAGMVNAVAFGAGGAILATASFVWRTSGGGQLAHTFASLASFAHCWD